MRIGMLAIQALEQLQGGKLAGVLLLVFEAGQQLVLDARQGVGGEGRLADHLFEQLECRLALRWRAEAAQAGDGHVAVGAVAELGAQAFEALGDGGDVLAGHSFVEHGIGQGGQAGHVVVAAAGGEGQTQVEHRQLARLDEQHAGAFGGLPALDVQGALARRLALQRGQGFQLGRCRRIGGWRLRGARGDECQQPDQQDQAEAEQAVAQAVTLAHGWALQQGSRQDMGDRQARAGEEGLRGFLDIGRRDRLRGGEVWSISVGTDRRSPARQWWWPGW